MAAFLTLQLEFTKTPDGRFNVWADDGHAHCEGQGDSLAEAAANAVEGFDPDVEDKP